MHGGDIAAMEKKHRIVARKSIEPAVIEKGYTNRVLRIDLAGNEITEIPVTQQMKDLWVGGKGFDLWLMLQEVNRQTKWDSPENPLCFSAGPLGGTTSFPGAGKTLVTALSPLTGSVMDCNVGGYFGPYLKFSGYDALVIVGKASEESIILIDGVNNEVRLETAPSESVDAHVVSEELTAMYADNEDDRRNIAVVSAGRGAQHTRMGVLNFSFYDWRRRIPRLKQAGRGGLGSVFRNKNLKAMVVKNREALADWKIEPGKAAMLLADRMPGHESHNSGQCCCSGADNGHVARIVEKWNRDPEYVIEMMQDVQDSQRCISSAAIGEISSLTGVPKARLFHIATFYKAFTLRQRGLNLVEICVGTACHVKGAVRVLETFERELGISRGDTTSDGIFSLEAVACLGCCSIAPAIRINGMVIGNVSSGDVRGIIEDIRKKTDGEIKESGNAAGKGAGNE